MEEIDGPRLTRLKEILTKSIQEVLLKCHVSQFTRGFGRLEDHQRISLTETHSQVMEALKDNVLVEFSSPYPYSFPQS